MCIELIEESCSAADFNCFSPYVSIRDARGDKAKVRVWQLVNEVESGVCSDSGDEYQVLYTRIENANGELECKRKNNEECGRIGDIDSLCTVDNTHTEVEMWINTVPNDVNQAYTDDQSCAELRDTPDPSFCYFKYRINCSKEDCDP